MKRECDDRLFNIGMNIRIVYGFIRILFGLALLKVIGDPIIDVFTKLMSHELIEDKSDILYTSITGILTHHPLYVTYFLAIYFIFWGTLDVILSYNLIKRRLWAFPVSFLVIGLFVVYEVIRFTHTHSHILLGVIVLDLFILWLIWREYKKLKTSSLRQIS